MEEKTSDFEEQTEEQTTSIVKIEELSLEDTQLAEQLYNSAGLDPVVDAGLKDYDKHIQIENKLINKVLGTRGSDIRGYGEAVAKRVSLAIYDQLNRQYGGKVGNLRSYIMSLEEDRDRANTRYDELMGRVIGILGEEYKALRTDSNTFMEKLTTLIGEDREAAKIDQKELAERLADIDGLRAQIQTLAEEKKQQKENSEAEMAAQKKEQGALQLCSQGLQGAGRGDRGRGQVYRLQEISGRGRRAWGERGLQARGRDAEGRPDRERVIL